MPLIESVVQSVVKSAVQRVDGVLKTPTIFDDAFAIYGVVDYVGNGDNVIRFYNSVQA